MMREMTPMCGICGRRFKYVRIGLSIWEMPEICVKKKRLKYMENHLDMSKTAKVCGKWLRYVGIDFSM